MRITLIHNPDAGEKKNAPSAEELKRLLREHGHDVFYQPASVEGFAAALDKDSDLVVAAGGDGTVTSVLKAVNASQTAAILPLGTANNIGRSLGLKSNVAELVRQWPTLPKRNFDQWACDVGGRSHRIIEGCGLGVLTQTAATVHELGNKTNAEEKLSFARSRLRALAENAPPFTLSLTCEDTTIEGEFLLVEFLNVGMLGPRLPLVQATKSDDGYLDVLCVAPAQRREFCNWLDAGTAQSFAAEPSQRGREMKVEFEGAIIRLGDNLFWPERGMCSGRQQAIFAPGRTVTILAPH